MNEPEQFKKLATENDILISSDDNEFASPAPDGIKVKVIPHAQRYHPPMPGMAINPYVQIFKELAAQTGVYLGLRIIEGLIGETTKDLYIAFIKKPFLKFLKQYKNSQPHEIYSGNQPVNMVIQLTPGILLVFNFLRSMDEEDYDNAFKNLPIFLKSMKVQNPSPTKDLDSLTVTKSLFCYFDTKKQNWFVESWAGYTVIE